MKDTSEPTASETAQPGAERVAAADPTTAWLIQSSQQRLDAGELFQSLCERLLGEGIPLFRASCGLIATHPQVFGRNFLWSRGEEVQTVERPHGIHQSEAYRNSPVALIHQGTETVRRRLDGKTPVLDFLITRELQALGATDYVAMAMHFSHARRNYVSWATDRPGGFTDAQIARLASILPLVTMRLELEASYFTTRTLLSVYLGKGAGKRVLEGTIRRAEGEIIRAAVWYSDLRGFTAMAEGMSSGEVIETLDDYFDCMVSAVHENQGEVLKFIGDGMLAIFPVEGVDATRACARAMAAIHRALSRLAALNRQRTANHKEPLRGGIALHIGEIVYGNIGAEDRLDFTAIGPAVNLVSRLEPLCALLGQPVLVSEDFAHCSGVGDLLPLGSHKLRGIPIAQKLFTLPSERLPSSKP